MLWQRSDCGFIGCTPGSKPLVAGPAWLSGKMPTRGRRLYFLLPDLDTAIRISDQLPLEGIEPRHVRFLGRRGISLGKLREAGLFYKTDLERGARFGILLGGSAGLLVGSWLFLVQPEGISFGPLTILLGTLLGALLCTWHATLVAVSAPNARLRPFQQHIEAGKILLIADVPLARVSQLHNLVHAERPKNAKRRQQSAVDVGTTESTVALKRYFR
jgi:hypothetical protein